MSVDDWRPGPDLLVLAGKTGPRVVPVPRPNGEALGRYLRGREGHRDADLLASRLGRRCAQSESGISQLLTRRHDMVGVARRDSHKLRHTWTQMFRAERDVLSLAGWISAATARCHGRSAVAECARAAERNVAVGDRL